MWDCTAIYLELVIFIPSVGRLGTNAQRTHIMHKPMVVPFVLFSPRIRCALSTGDTIVTVQWQTRSAAWGYMDAARRYVRCCSIVMIKIHSTYYWHVSVLYEKFFFALLISRSATPCSVTVKCRRATKIPHTVYKGKEEARKKWKINWLWLKSWTKKMRSV